MAEFSDPAIFTLSRGGSNRFVFNGLRGDFGLARRLQLGMRPDRFGESEAGRWSCESIAALLAEMFDNLIRREGDTGVCGMPRPSPFLMACTVAECTGVSESTLFPVQYGNAEMPRT